MAEAVERQPAIAPDPGALDRRPERLTDLAVVERMSDRVGEHEVIGSLTGTRQPLRPQQPHDGWSQDDLPPSGLGLELGVLLVARQLAVDPEQPRLEVDVPQVRPRPSPARSPVNASSSNSGRYEPAWSRARPRAGPSSVPTRFGLQRGFSPGSRASTGFSGQPNAVPRDHVWTATITARMDGGATTFEEPVIRAEAVRFGRYLTGADPSEAIVERYLAAVRTKRFEIDGRDRRTFDFISRHPRMLGLIDGGLGLRRPRSAVRVRLLVMAAILEATTDHADDFLPAGRSAPYVFYIGFVAVRAGIRATVGAVLVTWI